MPSLRRRERKKKEGLTPLQDILSSHQIWTAVRGCLYLNVTSRDRCLAFDPLQRYSRTLPDVFVQAEFLEHEQVVYLGVMSPYFGPGTDGCQLQAREVLALVTKVESLDVDAAIISLAEAIPVRPSLLRTATGAFIV
jgi:hypothetical protein